MTVPEPTDTRPSKKRRSPISRAEGERRLIEAALKLVQERPFSEVSVRTIADVADVNHGFVHTWFGSKNDLLAAVTQMLSKEISDEAAKAPPGTEAVSAFDDRLVLLVRLVIWLNLEGYSFPGGLNLSILQALEHRYATTDGLTPQDAHGAAIIATAVGIAVGAFRPIMEAGTPVDLSRIYPTWRHILGLLAEHPSQ
jgi:AcrR family transcriptional regulator